MGQHSPGKLAVALAGHCKTGQARFEQMRFPSKQRQVKQGSSVVVTSLPSGTNWPLNLQSGKQNRVTTDVLLTMQNMSLDKPLHAGQHLPDNRGKTLVQWES